MKYNILLAMVVFVLACNPEKVIEQNENWYKGNLHTHSLWSDGDDYPEMIMDWYKNNDYHFVALSDHNILQEGEKWVKVTKSPMRQKAFDKYQNKYGGDWVVTREDTAGVEVKLKKLEEYRSLFEETGKFIMMKAEEISSSWDGKPVHVNGINTSELIGKQTGNSIAEVMQSAVNAVLAQREKTGQPMFPHINHPNFHYAITIADMIALEGERFFEVYNGHPQVNNYGDEDHPGTEEIWDRVNLAYINADKPLLFGIATDDSHNYHTFGSQFSNTGRGWVMVNADSLNPASLIGAMEKGDFYATSGVLLKNISVTGDGLSFDIIQEEGVKYVTHFIGIKKGMEHSEILAEQEGIRGEYNCTGEELFVRAKIISNKLKFDPFEVGEYEAAWTQPFEVISER
ncbi:MAG: histidinol-phosphatase [Cyclobacteriaceae bacterium]|nr:histidinol-phosphatase [Cyclobacteriaceae bacterium]